MVLPVHDEEELALAALASIDRAIASASGLFMVSGIAIVLDACTDRSAELVAEWRQRSLHRIGNRCIEIVATDAGSVGHARKLGSAALLEVWADAPTATVWLSTTDADSQVPRDWTSAQLRIRSEGGQVWVGPVTVDDWSGRSAGTGEEWRRRYETEGLPIHGANFGIDAATYLEAGGFADLPTGEDRDLFGANRGPGGGHPARPTGACRYQLPSGGTGSQGVRPHAELHRSHDGNVDTHRPTRTHRLMSTLPDRPVHPKGT